MGLIMSANDQDEIRSIAMEIKHYLDEHPNAADSVEGIAKWWLTRQRYEEALERVQKALDYLVVNGMVQSVKARTDKVIYLNVNKTDDTKH